ncbi:MAG TPA: HDIG domain-containing protein [Myxococcota bacterium]|nr:HDIG domain-containing protein [Myxococcota bacterium]HRY92099.1 HDIG domain-containing protein [Myxococcota bacterium]
MASDRPTRERRLATWLAELRDWRAWVRSLGFWAGLCLLGVTVAIMVNPATTSPSLPLLDEEIGRVARADIRAPMSFPVPDVETTERKRQEASDSILSVYDHEAELGAQRIQRLRDAFGEMQRVIETHRAQVAALEAELTAAGVDLRAPAEDAGRKPRPPRGHAPGPGAAAEPEAVPANPRDELERLKASLDGLLDQQKGQFLRALQVVVKDEDFARLKAEGFSPASLNAIASLVDRVMRNMVVSSRELLEADRSKGLTVRFLKDGTSQSEALVTSFARLLDMEEALQRVRQNAALELPDMQPGLRVTVIRLAESLVTPNLFFNRVETDRRKQQARARVQPLEISIRKGEKIIREGDLIEKRHIRVFQEMARRTDLSNAPQLMLGMVLLVTVLLYLLSQFARLNIRKFRAGAKELALMGVVMFTFLVSVKLWFWVFGAVSTLYRTIPLESYYFAIPFAAGAMLVRFVLNSEMALTFTAAASFLAGILMEGSLPYGVFCLASSLVGAGALRHVKQRNSLLRAGATTGLLNVLLALSISMLGQDFLTATTLWNALFAFSGGILAAIIVLGVAPILEAIFGFTTDITLLELANLNHPLLKELIVQAPGSYHHSIIVGSLVEAAAETIHCNPLLARVMAYYHDIGKIKKPQYFSENQRDGTNRHDKLKPSLSASVLRAHVKDGAELARASRLGRPIVEAIQQHHGTSLIKFFFQRAKDQAGADEVVREEDFRYPGPKPQSREVALVMLADAVEAAAKSVSDPSPARLQGLVQNIINRIFVDGQLDECDLTLKDLHVIARAFNRVLTGIYHHRPDYPEAATKETREREAREAERLAADLEAELARGEAAARAEAEGSRPEDIKRLGQ